MQTRKKISLFYRLLQDYKRDLLLRNDAKFQNNFTAAELIRNTHSIEKGLSIEKPRLGFGHEKQKEMIAQITKLEAANSPYCNEVCDMAVSALNSYLEYHQKNNYSDNFCTELKKFVSERTKAGSFCNGGTISIKKSELEVNVQEVERLFNTRHSIRNFADTEVNDSTLRKALALAQRAPSACNRQGVRAYVLSTEKSRELAGSLSGIGGFAEQVNRFILVTGKKSTYRTNELYQYIVSASIYAAYLSLTLHLYGLGACVVQRSVIWTKEWETLRIRLGIDSDEQLVVLLAVGNLKDAFEVPYSHRISGDCFARFIE